VFDHQIPTKTHNPIDEIPAKRPHLVFIRKIIKHPHVHPKTPHQKSMKHLMCILKSPSKYHEKSTKKTIPSVPIPSHHLDAAQEVSRTARDEAHRLLGHLPRLWPWEKPWEFHGKRICKWSHGDFMGFSAGYDGIC